MARTVRTCTGGIVIAAALLGIVPPATADQTEPPTITLAVVNHAEVSQNVLKRAETEATRIYRSTGVNVVWTDRIEPAAHPRVIVQIISREFGRMSADWLGLAPRTKARRDLRTWVFYHRIVDFVTILGLDPGLLLGHVIAHEIGHLLLPYDSHAPAGLMSGRWDRLQATSAAMGSLTFTPVESALIRRTLARMVANR